MEVRFAVLLSLLLAACGGASPDATPLPAPRPDLIRFVSDGDNWNSKPVKEQLTEVSNNGLGYTGDIHVYEIEAPATGRMQFSLVWEHSSDFDLIVAADRGGINRLAEGINTSNTPEYVGLNVIEGQLLFVLIAGWEGEPGEYELETILVPGETPVFAMEDHDDFSQPVPRNAPIRFSFNHDIDPGRVIADTVAFTTTGHAAEGTWCIEESDLIFHPRPPEAPGDGGGLHADSVYTLQFAPAGRGIRATNGEYLFDLITLEITVGGLIDDDPQNPPRVIAMDHSPTQAWLGTPITLTIDQMLDPDSIEAHLLVLDPLTGAEIGELTIRLTLSQRRQACIGGQPSRLIIEPLEPLPPNTPLRLRLPGTVLGITGDPSPENSLTPFHVDLYTG